MLGFNTNDTARIESEVSTGQCWTNAGWRGRERQRQREREIARAREREVTRPRSCPEPGNQSSLERVEDGYTGQQRKEYK